MSRVYKNKKIVAIIPARGGSKSIPRKNIKLLHGRPLVAYIIETSLQSKYIDRTIVSTEDKEIAEISRRFGAEIVERPVELSTDETPDTPVLKHAVDYLSENENYIADVVVFLHATSPLCETADINNAIEKLFKTNADLVVGVVEVKHHPFWSFTMVGGDKLLPFVEGGLSATRRQDLPKIYTLNGAVYVMRVKRLQNDSFLGGDIRGLIMTKEKSVDIDTELDLEIAALLMKKRGK